MFEQDRTALARFGPFFALVSPAEKGSQPWWGLTEVVHGPMFHERIAATQVALGRGDAELVEPRVAASTFSFDLFARLAAPVFGAALLGTRAPDLASIQWCVSESKAMSCTADTWTEPDPVTMHAVIFAPLVARLRREYAVSEHVSWGNVAAAWTGARAAVVGVAPELRARADDLLAVFLTDLGVADELDHSGRRRSCCLFYRVPGGGYCGDCVLVDR